MNNSIKRRKSKEIKIQLKKAEVQKYILIKNIYKEYENYFKIVRKSILSSAEKGIIGLCSELSISDGDKSLNTNELMNFLNKNMSFFINSKLPLLTIEQLRLSDISQSHKKLSNEKSINEFVEFKEYQVVDFDYENKINTKESPEFYCNNNLKSYEYYDQLSEDESLSVNLDENGYLNSFPKQNSIKNVEHEKLIIESVLELIEETKSIKIDYYKNLHDQVNDVFISSDNLNFFEIIDKAFSNFLLNFSYKINSELFKINLIKKIITEDTFKCLSKNNSIIKHPHPFVIRYDLNQSKLSANRNTSFDIYLFNISDIELEFYNLDLSICRNNINNLKNRFRLLNKKHSYWKNKDLTFENLN